MKILNIVIWLAFSFKAIAIDKDEMMQNTTINFLWIYKEKPIDQTYVVPNPYLRKISRHNNEYEEYDTIERFNQWAELNPGTKIRIWHDSLTSPDNAKENTLRELNFNNNFEIIDLREYLKEDYEKRHFEDMPIYFLVDFLRIYVTVKDLNKTAKNSFFMYVDLSIDPKSLDEIYDEQTVSYINTYGMVLGKTSRASYENSFHIIGNNYDNLLGAIYIGVIYKSFINKKNSSEQAVYGNYVNIIPFFLTLEKIGNISIKKYKNLLDYNEEFINNSIEDLKNIIKNNDSSWLYHPPRDNPNIEIIPTKDGMSKVSKFNN